MLGRRKLLQLLGMVPAVPFAPNVVMAELITKAAPFAALGPLLGDSNLPSIHPKTAIGKLLEEATMLAEQECWTRANARSGFDHDIAAMKSWSNSYKQMKQIQREREVNSLIRKARSLMWN